MQKVSGLQLIFIFIKMTNIVRLTTGFTLVFVAVFIGFIGRSPWIIAPLGGVFSILYFLGKKAEWALLLSHSASGIVKAFILSYLVQTTVCGIFYLLGRGLGNLFDKNQTTGLNSFDYSLVAGVLAVGILSSTILWIMDRKQANALDATEVNPVSNNKSGYKMVFDPEPITLENFYTSLFYGHHDRNNHENPDDEGLPKVLPEKAKTTEAMIKVAEERLNIVFPSTLKKLYARQNGGMVGNLWVAAVANPSLDLEDWRGVFSHDYCYLAPLEYLRTLYDSYLDFKYEDEIEQDNQIPKNAKQYIILCQRYMDTTFLDYSQSKDDPRVGIVDFDGNDGNDVWFESFDAFLSALKRGDLEYQASS